MSCSPRFTRIPLTLAVACALCSGSAAWAQVSPGFKLLLGDLAPVDLTPSGVDSTNSPVYLRFATSNRSLNVVSSDAVLCFDFTAGEGLPATKLRLGLSLPSGTSEVFEGVSAAAISVTAPEEDKLVYLQSTDLLNCFAFPRAELATLEQEKQSRLSGSQARVFGSSFDLREALPALLLEVRDPLRTPASSSPQVGDTVKYTVRVSAQDRGEGGTLEQVRLRDYVPAVSVMGEALGLAQNATLLRCSINGVAQESVQDPFDPQSPLVPDCSRDSLGFLRFNAFPDSAPGGLAIPAGSEIEFELERTVVADAESPGGSDVYVIAAASANPAQASLGSLDDAFHVFTFS